MAEDVVVSEQVVEAEGAPEVPAQSIEDREQAVALKENSFEAKAAFAKASIPDSLLEFVVHADKAVQQANIDKFSKAWTDALKSAVKGRVASEPPASAGKAPVGDFNRMSYREKLELKRTNPALYRNLSGGYGPNVRVANGPADMMNMLRAIR